MTTALPSADVGLRCPQCQSADLAVIDSRPVRRNAIRRRHDCKTCRHRFTSYEVLAETLDDLYRLPDQLQAARNSVAELLRMLGE